MERPTQRGKGIPAPARLRADKDPTSLEGHLPPGELPDETQPRPTCCLLKTDGEHTPVTWLLVSVCRCDVAGPLALTSNVWGRTVRKQIPDIKNSRGSVTAAFAKGVRGGGPFHVSGL